MARKLSFWRGKYALRDGPKFNLIGWLDPKFNFLIGFWLELLSKRVLFIYFLFLFLFFLCCDPLVHYPIILCVCVRVCVCVCITFFGFEISNFSSFLNFLEFLVFVLIRESGSDKLRYRQSSLWNLGDLPLST